MVESSLSSSLKEIKVRHNDNNFSIKFDSSPSNLSLEIIFPFLLSTEQLSQTLYSLYNKLFYLFNYLDYKIKFVSLPDISENTLRDYLNFLYLNPFLWKGRDLATIMEQWQLTTKINFWQNILRLPPVEQKSSIALRSDILILKKALGELGLEKISFTSQQIKKITLPRPKKKETIASSSVNPNSKFDSNDSKSIDSQKKQPLTEEIHEKWQAKKLIELGIHTKFSALDGISSPIEYLKEAREKDYSALGITDHYNVQSFPEFWQNRSPDIKLLWGCEMEMLEDKLPPYIFNDDNQQKFLEQKIEDLTYCVFDLETTGFFSQYNHIIEIGYVIWKNGEILKERVHLVRPEKKIAPEVLKAWYTDIDPKELEKAPPIRKILPSIREDWKNCVLVAHNARNFDFTFLNKAWKETFGQELPYPLIDTLPLAWILLPEKKTFSLAKLSRTSGKDKIKQAHRALDDSKLLADLFGKLLKILKDKEISQWKKTAELINHQYFPNRGYKVKVLARNQQGLNSLYRLITLSHTDNLFKTPCVFRSDLEKHRANLLIGAAGNRDGEIFSLFSAFQSSQARREAIKFYDYLEIDSPSSWRHFWLNGRIRETELKEMLWNIIQTAKSCHVPTVANHNVYYCQSEQKIVKQIVVANEGMNGRKHSLYNEATLDGKEDRFANLPEQHLRTKEEIIKDWSFLNDAALMEELIFTNPQNLVDKIEEIIIFDGQMQYPDFSENEAKLEKVYQTRIREMFGADLPNVVKERIEKEWNIIKENYLSIYWLAYQIVQKAHQDGFIVGSRGSVGSSLIAYLLNITDLNPLPPYYFCPKCQYFALYQTDQKVFSCYDVSEPFPCPNCQNNLKLEGHNLPFETFFGWKGEKIPDIDLNFSGEYQKNAHDYVRKLLGEEFVYRIGTINKLSQQTAEIFLREYKQLKKKLNPRFNVYNNNGNDEKLIEQLKGIKRTTGQHPGGLLVIPKKIDIHDYTPLNYPADNKQAQWKTTHLEYNFLAKIFLKLDILGHDEPTVLQKLYELTKKNPADISFSDPEIMKVFTEVDTTGIPEFGTKFVKNNFLKYLKPAKFSHLVQISGFSHGTNVWTQNQQHFYKEGMKLEELIACREDIWTFLTSWGVDNKTAFLVSEYIRKGRWADLKMSIKKLICEKLGLTNELVEKLTKNWSDGQENLFENISQEIAKLDPDKLNELLKELNTKLT